MSYPRYTLARSFKKVIGDGLGNHVKAAGAPTTFADIAAAYSIVLAAQVGDELLIRLSGQWFHTTNNGQTRVRFLANGTALPLLPTNGLFLAGNQTNSTYVVFEWMHTVVSGDLVAGYVTVKPQHASEADTLTLRNDGTNGKPLFTVQNLGPADPH